MIYFNIRVVEAEDYNEATEKVEDNVFMEVHPICDKILTKTELIELLSQIDTDYSKTK